MSLKLTLLAMNMLKNISCTTQTNIRGMIFLRPPETNVSFNRPMTDDFGGAVESLLVADAFAWLASFETSLHTDTEYVNPFAAFNTDLK